MITMDKNKFLPNSIFKYIAVIALVNIKLISSSPTANIQIKSKPNINYEFANIGTHRSGQNNGQRIFQHGDISNPSTKKNSQVTRNEYSEGHPDMIIFPSSEEHRSQRLPSALSAPVLNPQYAYNDDSENMANPSKSQRVYLDKAKFNRDRAPSSWYYRESNEATETEIGRGNVNVKKLPHSSSFVPQPVKSTLTFPFLDEESSQANNDHDKDDTGYKSLIIFSSRTSACPKGKRRTHAGHCRTVRNFRITG